MRARFVTLTLLAFFVAGCASVQPMSADQRASQVIGSAQVAFENLKTSSDVVMDDFRALLPKAQGIVIFPGLLKGGFIVGAEGGNGVLLAKDASGNWGQPAFYFMASGSIGLQIGAQATDVVMLVFSQKAIASIIAHQGKLGADLGITFGTLGAGVEASTTTNIGADIMAFSQGVGAYAGGSFEAAALIKRNDLNEVFYGRPATPEEIVLQGQVQSPAADALRASLNAQ